MSNRIEDNLQIQCVKWFYLQYPTKMIMSYPAGFAFKGDARQRAITGKRMKDMGYLVGTPDLHIPVAKNGFNGLYIEMKAGKNKPSDNQITIMKKLENEGYVCTVCYSLSEFMKVVNTYFNDK